MFYRPDDRSNEKIIDQIYATPSNSHTWSGLLNEICETIGADGGFVSFTPPKLALGHVATGVVEKHYSEYLIDGHCSNDIRAQRLFDYNAPRFFTEVDLVSPKEFETHPFYTDFIRSRLGGRHTAAMISPRPDIVCSLHFERDETQGTYPPEAIRWLDSLYPHFSRALTIASGNELSRIRSVTSNLAAIGVPAAFISFGARIEASNELFADAVAPFLRINADALAFNRTDSNQRLARALQGFELNWVLKKAPQAAVSVPIRIEEPSRRYLVHLARNSEGPESTSVGVLMMVVPVGAAGTLPIGAIEYLFGLTGAEAQVAREVGAGLSVSDVASRRRLSEHTVRGHMKSIYEKLDVHRQIDLIKLLQHPFESL